MTIDKQKRKTLKILSATGAAAGALATPTLLNAACQHSTRTATAEETIPLRGTGLVISFSSRSNISPGKGSRTVVITNTSNENVTLSHVYPGIVDTTEGRYDINSILANGPRVFEPNQPVFLQLEAVAKNATERSIPTGLKSMDSVAVSTHAPGVNNGMPVNTMRTLLS